jgi:hypothetical protein
MAVKKNQKYVIELEFKNDRPGFYRQVATVNGKDFGIDFNVEYGAYIAPGNMGADPPRPHTHDYNQVMLFLGCNPNDMGELGAEIELGLGEDGETYMITTSSVATIPAGMAHYPAHINKMDRRFVYMEVSTTTKNAMKTLPALKKRQEPGTIDIGKAKHWQKVAGATAMIQAATSPLSPIQPNSTTSSCTRASRTPLTVSDRSRTSRISTPSRKSSSLWGRTLTTSPSFMRKRNWCWVKRWKPLQSPNPRLPLSRVDSRIAR